MLTVTARHVTLQSGRILWTEVFGNGSSAILFANGMASTTNAWNSLICGLPEQFLSTHTIVLHDAANTGKSPYQPHLPEPTLGSLAAEARNLLELLGFKEGYFVGHSFGGQQGFVAAAQDSAFWKALLLLAPQTDHVTPRTVVSMRNMIEKFDAEPETAAYANEIYDTLGQHMLAKSGIYGAFAREMALRQNSKSLVLAFRALLSPKESEFIWPNMKTRIILVYGGRDEIAPVSQGVYAHDKLVKVEGTNAKLVIWKEAGHWMNWELEDRTRDIIMEMVEN
jgi:pimeloyl-ACP methyl ester carboxylesterase